MGKKPAYPSILILTVFVRKLARSTDECVYFSKYGQRSSRKFRNHNMNKCKFVASQVNRWTLMELLCLDICIFQAIPRGEVYSQSWLVKTRFKTMNIDFAFKALQELAIFRYGGFEFKAVGDKWQNLQDDGCCLMNCWWNSGFELSWKGPSNQWEISGLLA